jgi:predicted RNase H-like HicB family nuclease
MPQYIALLHKNGRRGYGVSFPDFPGCVTAGKTIEESLREASDALAFHVQGMREDRIKIPKPRTVEAIREAHQDWVDFEGAIIATVPFCRRKAKL